MPSIEFKCRECGHAFSRVALRGEAARVIVCPQCRRKTAHPAKPPESLFNGISSFSTLSKDTN